jgi:hypothetical protein
VPAAENDNLTQKIGILSRMTAAPTGLAVSRLQAFIKIGEHVVLVLDAAGQAQQVGRAGRAGALGDY